MEPTEIGAAYELLADYHNLSVDEVRAVVEAKSGERSAWRLAHADEVHR